MDKAFSLSVQFSRFGTVMPERAIPRSRFAIATGFTLNVSIPLLARVTGLVAGFVGVLIMGLTKFPVGVCRG